jgi:hypothetical protein
MAEEVLYGKTPEGQLVYDLCFVDRTDKWLARKFGIPIAKIRAMRYEKSVKKLRKQNGLTMAPPPRAPREVLS